MGREVEPEGEHSNELATSIGCWSLILTGSWGGHISGLIAQRIKGGSILQLSSFPHWPGWPHRPALPVCACRGASARSLTSVCQQPQHRV